MVAMPLDAKDKRILEQLDLNSRQSNSRIAKKVGLGKDAVGYRIRNLEKEGVIEGYYTLFNISKLGYVAYKFMLTLQNATSEIEKKITADLKKSPDAGWIASCDGYYNIMAIVWVKSANEFYDYFTDFLRKYSQYIKERDVLVITEIHSCHRAYLFDKHEDETPETFYGNEPTEELDSTDHSILKYFANNSRVHLQKIASALELTPEAVAYRLKRLQKSGVIQGFRPIINTTRLGYQYYNVLFRLKHFNNLKKMFKFFKLHPNIVFFVKYLGDYDIGIDLEVKNAEELRKTISEIKDIFSEDIESYNTVSIYRQDKLSFLPE